MPIMLYLRFEMPILASRINAQYTKMPTLHAQQCNYPHNAIQVKLGHLLFQILLHLADLVISSPRVQIRQIAVPAQTDNIHHQHTMLQRYQREIHALHRRPHRPVGLQPRKVSLLQPLLRRLALQIRHRRQEERHIRRCKDRLIHQYARHRRRSFTLEIYTRCEELVPFRCCWAEDHYFMSALCCW